MKKLITLFFVLISTVSFAWSDLYPAPTTWSFAGLASSTQPRIASGTALPAVASATIGDIFISIADPALPIIYIKGASSWAGVGAANPYQTWSASGSVIATYTLVTPEGGTAVRLTASGTTAFQRGDVVCVGTSANSTFILAPADSAIPIGAVWGGVNGSTTCAVGSDAWIVTNGIGHIKIDTEVTTRGGVLYLSGSNAGQSSWSATKPTQSDHDKELGHALETGSASAVIKAIIHFN